MKITGLERKGVWRGQRTRNEKPRDICCSWSKYTHQQVNEITLDGTELCGWDRIMWMRENYVDEIELCGWDRIMWMRRNYVGETELCGWERIMWMRQNYGDETELCGWDRRNIHKNWHRYVLHQGTAFQGRALCKSQMTSRVLRHMAAAMRAHNVLQGTIEQLIWTVAAFLVYVSNCCT
jgi:hypothetical protein